jgi:hypothetical protein
MLVRPWRSGAVFGPRTLCALFQFAKSGVIRLIFLIATAVPMSQAPRA